MFPEQIFGALFVLLMALVAWSIGEPAALLGLALGGAVAWGASVQDELGIRQYLILLALLIWAAVFGYLVWKVIF